MSGYDYQDKTGVMVPDTETIETEVQDEYKGVFGSDLSTDPETPQGILITSETTNRKGTIEASALTANQINPNLAQGVFLDAIAGLTGVVRGPGAPSSFAPAVVGTIAPGTLTVDTTMQAVTEAGDIFNCLTTVDVSAGGSFPLEFVSEEVDAIPCPVDGLVPVPHPTESEWSGMVLTNSTAAVLGSTAESDLSFRKSRNATLGLQGSGLALAVYSNVQNVAGVLSLKMLENEKATAETIEGLLLAQNSIWVCVDGGTDADVGLALLASKGPGCAWNNGLGGTPVSIAVVEPTSGQNYTVLFDRVDEIPMLFDVIIDATTISNPTALIQSAIKTWADGGLEGQEGLLTGTDVSPFEAAAAINAIEPRLNVTYLATKKAASGAFAAATVVLTPYERGTVQLTSITVTVSP